MPEITLDTRQVSTALNNLSAVLTNLQQPLDEIGKTIADNIALNFRDEQSPDGQPWQGLSDTTIARRRHGSGNGSDKILQYTGVLKNSITHNVSGNSVEVGVNEVGTNLEYATTQQFGASKGEFGNGAPWGDIPARPFIPENALPSDWESEVLDIISSHLQQSLDHL